MKALDHLVLAAPDLETGIEHVSRLTGVRAAYGGSHPGFGTHNAIASLGDRCYLEIIAPDPDQDGASWFGLDDIRAPRITTWAAARHDLSRYAGLDLGGETLGAIMSMSRTMPDGKALSWSLTDPRTVIGQGVVPFLIDWGDSPHPAANAPAGAILLAMEIEHPDPQRMTAVLRMLDIDIPVGRADRPAITATIETPAGRITMR